MENGDGRPPLGVTRVANEVVAWIAALTALQVPGVHAMYQAAGQSLERILRRPYAHRGARVQVRDGSTLDIDLFVVLLAGHSAPRVGAEVQRRVADALGRMLGLEVGNIDVHISEVVFV
ncbi:MAG TPA: Asp23/Gls24 family envelope stress response protein [Candidatus Binatia bacterium]|nr:Asp23/Gls24 family envelope stress response protein [Candidatus Binatia bacterium]